MFRTAEIGPPTTVDIIHGTDVRLDFAELATGDYANVPLPGTVLCRHRGIDVAAGTDTASMFGPVGETTVTKWTALVIRLDDPDRNCASR